jgi:hypothetical protein
MDHETELKAGTESRNRKPEQRKPEQRKPEPKAGTFALHLPNLSEQTTERLVQSYSLAYPGTNQV